jgi:cyclase
MFIRKLFIFVSFFTLRSACLFAGDLQGTIFAISKISKHVYIAHPERIKRINSTSTIIVSENYITVIESQTDIFMATELIKEIREKISGLPIKYLVFSHFHSDHTLGAAAFLKENPSLIIIAHENTAQHMLLYAAGEQKSWAEIVKQKSIDARDSAAVAQNAETKAYLFKTADELETYYKDIQSSIIINPNLTFSDSLTLSDNGLKLQLLFLGAGHTPGDIVVLIPQDEVLVTGDLVHDYEPLFWDADPDSWIETLEKLKQLDFEYFVGGHGDSHHGKDIISLWENYIKELKSKTIGAIKQGLPLAAFQQKITLESFSSLQNGYGERIQKFRTSCMEYWTGPLLDAVKDEIAYMWKFYCKRSEAQKIIGTTHFLNQ